MSDCRSVGLLWTLWTLTWTSHPATALLTHSCWGSVIDLRFIFNFFHSFVKEKSIFTSWISERFLTKLYVWDKLKKMWSSGFSAAALSEFEIPHKLVCTLPPTIKIRNHWAKTVTNSVRESPRPQRIGYCRRRILNNSSGLLPAAGFGGKKAVQLLSSWN